MKKTPPCWTVLDEKEKPVHIEHARRNTLYFCPDCGGVMIPKMGDVKAHHFAHKPNEDGSEISCGGEGYRHFRVKTFTYTMLNSVARHKFAFDLQFVMEKAQGQDIPDISVLKQIGEKEEFKQEILAIEVVDTHPPSDEKRARWENMMLEIKITDWNDELIGNAANLSGALIPWLCGFQSFIDSIQKEENKTKIALEKLTQQRLVKIEELEQKFETELTEMKKSSLARNTNSMIASSFPNVWFGNWARISKSKQIYVPYKGYEDEEEQISWGVSIKTYSEDQPKPGDWVWIKRKKDGSFQHAILGARFDIAEYFDEDYASTVICKHHLVSKAKNPPELKELIQNYKIIQ